MLWFVYVDGHYLGTVVADSSLTAEHAAIHKFPIWGLLSVRPRQRKRRKTRG